MAASTQGLGTGEPAPVPTVGLRVDSVHAQLSFLCFYIFVIR